MPFRSTLLKVTCFCLFSALLLAPGSTVFSAEPASTRVIVGLGTADRVLQGLEYCVVVLAGKKDSWEERIKPNMEIFLYGVNTEEPIRFDMIFDSVHGRQMQAAIPVSDLKEFIADDLEPIGIEVKPDRGDKNLYKVSGTVYEGWMRYLPQESPYAVFFPQKEAIGKDMPHPVTHTQELAEKEFMAFMSMNNSADDLEERKAAYATVAKQRLDEFQKLTSETKEQFELRKRLRQQFSTVISQWFSESKNIQLGLIIDKKKSDAPSTLAFSALPGTALEKDLKNAHDAVSLFSAIPAPAASVLSARLTLPVDEGRKAGYKELYELARPALQQRIDEDDKASAEEKTGRKELVGLFLELLTESMDKLSEVDAFIDVTPVKDKHSMILGLNITNAAKVTQMIQKIPVAKAGWKVDADIEKMGDYTLHKLTFGEKSPKSLIDFYGGSKTVYFAVSDKAFWISGGEGSLENLKSHLELAAKPLPEKGSGKLLTFQMHAHPIIKNVHEIMHDPELEVLNQMNLSTRKQRAAEEKPAAEKKKDEEGKPGSRAAELASFNWQDTAIATLQGTNDLFEMNLIVDDQYVLQGNSNAQGGILKALGAVIAKFADETLK